MSEDKRKSNVPPPPTTEEGVSVRFQARLYSKRPGEGDAIEILKEFKSNGWKERDLLREALFALKRQTDEGWAPIQGIDAITLNDHLLGAISQMVALARELSSIDLTGTQRHDGSAIDHDRLRQQLTEFDQSAARLVSDVRFFDDED